MYPFLKDASFWPCFCFVHTIAQFSRILRFSHIYCQMFRIRTHGISLNHLSIFYNVSCYNSLVLLTFVSRSSCRIAYIYSTLQVYQRSYSQVRHISPKMSEKCPTNVRKIWESTRSKSHIHDWSLYKPNTHIHDWWVVKWLVMYMGVWLVKWSVMYMGARVVKLSVMYMGVRLVKWSVMPFLTSSRKCFTSWHFKVCHFLPLIESVILIDTSKSAIPYL
jgi:hypothetical protein